MKHLKLFFALFAMLALGVGNAWAETVTMAAGTNGSACTVNGIDGIKVGTSSKGGNMTITVPAGATSLQLYAAAWKGVSGLSINITPITNVSPTSISLTADNGITSNSPFTLSGNAESFKHEIALSNITSETTLTLTSSTTKRFVVWGASCTVGSGEEPGTGGETPEPEPDPTPDPGTGGEALSYTWDLSTNSYSAASNTQVTWSATDVNMVVDKGTASTAPNNYLGGDANNRTSSRFYKNSILTITPEANVTITSVVFTATGTSYASALQGSTWTNASASVSGTTVTVTPTNGASAISATISGTCGFTGVTVYYTKAASGEPENPTPSVSVAPASHIFATTNVGETATQEFTITAENTAATLSASIDNTTDFAISAITGDKVTVTYQPQSAGDHTATMTVKAGEEASTTVALTGKAVAALEGTWILVTDASSLKAGDEIIIAAKDYDVALSTTQNNNNRGEIAITKNGNLITATSEVQVLTLQAGNKENTLALYTGAGYLHAASSGSNHLKTETTLSDNSSWTISIADGTATLTAQGTYTRNTMFYNQSSKIFACYASNTTTQKAIAIYKKVDDSEVLAPGFTPTGGTFYGAQSVEITCATAGAEIYYTLNGTDPTSASTKYTGAISIASTTTVKAIAVKGANSSAVVSATYTILAPLATMQEIFDKATAVGSTATPVKVAMNNWVVTGATDKNVYVTDGTKGFIIYKNDGGHGFVAGDVLVGTVACKVQLYNGSAELTELTSTTTGLTVSTGGTVTPVEVNDVTTLSGVNTGAVVKITGTCTQESSKYYVAGVQLYNSLFTYTNPTVGNKYNVTGVYLQYNSTKEILPRQQEDIEEVVDALPSATISIANITMEVGQEKTIEATITPVDAPITYETTATCITLNGTTITAVSEGTATITASIAEKAGEYTGVTKTFTVTVNAPNIATLPFEFNNGKANIENTLGMSQNGLGSDYGSAPLLKFDGTGDYVTIHFNAEPGKLSYDIKGNSYSGGTFTVQESADGSAYTNIVEYTELGSTETKTHTLAATSRYVKFIYTNKSAGNVALGNINIALPEEEPGEGGEEPVVPTITPTATFIFNTADGLNDLGIAYPTTADEDNVGAHKTNLTDGASFTQDGITMTSTDGTTVTRVWLTAAGKLDLRVYKNATLTFSVPENLQIQTVTFDGTNINHLLVDGVAVSGNTWTGGKQEVIFTAKADASTIKINTISFVIAYTRNVTNKFGTICLPYASASTSGAYFYEVVGKGTENGKPAVYLASVNSLKAGVPYIFEKTANTITVTYTGDPVATPANTNANGLIGTFVEIEVPNGDYILYDNEFCTNNDSSQPNNKIRANRAYLDMDAVTGGAPVQMPGRRYIGMSVQGENAETGFENITAPEGQAIKVISNGQLIIIRDGEMYNAQGQRL